MVMFWLQKNRSWDLINFDRLRCFVEPDEGQSVFVKLISLINAIDTWWTTAIVFLDTEWLRLTIHHRIWSQWWSEWFGWLVMILNEGSTCVLIGSFRFNIWNFLIESYEHRKISRRCKYSAWLMNGVALISLLWSFSTQSVVSTFIFSNSLSSFFLRTCLGFHCHGQISFARNFLHNW